MQHNYVRREHTATKSKKSRWVDLPHELRRVLVELRDKRLLEGLPKGKNDSSDELVFQTPPGDDFSILTTSTIESSCLCWPRRASARSAYTIYASMPSPRLCGLSVRCSDWRGTGRVLTRHNQRFSRKLNSLSFGRYRVGLTPSDSVRDSAFSFKRISA